MKIVATVILVILSLTNLQAQLLDKIKQKAGNAISKQIDKPVEKNQTDDTEKRSLMKITIQAMQKQKARVLI